MQHADYKNIVCLEFSSDGYKELCRGLCKNRKKVLGVCSCSDALYSHPRVNLVLVLGVC